jgi:colanic acid/amylovoran biosynthesis glycosyltransferase
VTRVLVLADRYPVPSETFVGTEVRALRDAGVDVRVEALAGGPADAVWETERTRERLAAMAWLAARHPLGVVRDLLARRRWRRAEDVPPLRFLAPAARRLDADHVHAHFAAGAALAALRLHRLTGVPFSVTAHGYDLFQRPANLAEKATAAAFATSGSDYTVAALRAAAPDAEVHKVVMGVDGDAFLRRTPHRDERVVLAVGRLVPKKGFGDLVAAAARLERTRVLIAGDGPLLEALRSPHVELLGAVGHERVRELLEGAAVLCMPCVVAADGDRDSMPVVVKEALAMEVPVVATDAVGLPEVVRPAWGALVPPHDPEALAAALAAELDRSVDARAARGRAGRAFVLEHCDARREGARLAALIRRS